MAASSATYMGLRTCRYSPFTTRRSGAATGAGVPRPSITKRTKDWPAAATPATTRAAPTMRSGVQPGSGSRSRQPVSSQGITPAIVPGATTKNSALPAAARILLTRGLPVRERWRRLAVQLQELGHVAQPQPRAHDRRNRPAALVVDEPRVHQALGPTSSHQVTAVRGDHVLHPLGA